MIVLLRYFINIALFFLLSVAFAFSSGVAFADNQYQKEKDWTLNLKDVDINVFLEQVSSITGENFVVDPQVKGKVSVIATTPMNRQAVNELLLTVLRVHSLMAVPSGSATRIVPQAGVKLGGSPSLNHGGGQRFLTKVVPVKNANIDEIVKLLKPLVSPSGYLDGSEFSNALIISDYADNITQIIRALGDLDKENDADVEVIPLQENWVGNIVPLIEAVAPMQLAENGKEHNRMKVIADERSNSIVVRGTPKEREKIRSLVAVFDKKNPNASNIQVIHLQYADAKEVAAILRGSLSTSSRNASPPLQPGMSAVPSPTSAAPSVTGKTGDGQEDITSASSFIQADTTLNSLIVKAEPAIMTEIRALVKQLDIRRPQVLIEAAIVELNAAKSQQFGMQLAGGDIAQAINSGSTQFAEGGIALGNMLTQLGNTKASAVTSEGLSVALGTGARFNILIQALAGTTGANLLSTPSIITLDNEEAKIIVGQNVPFRTGNFTTQSSGVTNPFTTIERQDIGITLKVTPHIHEGDLVNLNIEQEVSSIAPANAQTSGVADIITNKRTINTKILAENGETVVLGGLMENDATDMESKVPVLGDIPVLGALFRYSSHNVSKSNLLVFLKPTVLHGREGMADIVQGRYGHVYDLQIGKRNLADDEAPAMNVYYVPPAETVFGVAAKSELPWLKGNAKVYKQETIPPFSDVTAAAPQGLPWRRNAAKPADTMTAVPVPPVAISPITPSQSSSGSN